MQSSRKATRDELEEQLTVLQARFDTLKEAYERLADGRQSKAADNVVPLDAVMWRPKTWHQDYRKPDQYAHIYGGG